MANFDNRRRADRRFPRLVVGAAGVMGAAWLGGFAVAAGWHVPLWAVAAVGGAIVAVAGCARLFAKVNHGGDRRRPSDYEAVDERPLAAAGSR